MDIDEYLKQKKALEEQKKIIEGKEKIHEKKHKVEKTHHVEHPKEQPHHTSHHTQPTHSSKPHHEGGSHMKTLMIVNMVILIGVLAIVAVFYLFPPNFGGTIDPGEDKDKDQIKPIVKDKEPTKTNETQKKLKNESKDNTVYLGPEFSLTIQDIDEGPFKENGKLQHSGRILSIQGGIKYKDFSIAIQNKEKDKIFCEVDKKVDLDTDLDGTLDIKGIYSLNRQRVKIPSATKKVFQAGMESLPGDLQTHEKEYKGKGEIWAEYEVRCYFCLDDRCDKLERKGEGKQKALIRVRINDHLLIKDNNKTNKS
tara:strand:- start:67435 stop:68364 length:930 start_codon:yes stop_codon:yes gene_type:complete